MRTMSRNLECCALVKDTEYENQERCVRRNLEWFLDVASTFDKDELSIVVAPPHPNGAPDHFKQWARWITVYNEYAQAVDLMEYSKFYHQFLVISLSLVCKWTDSQD